MATAFTHAAAALAVALPASESRSARATLRPAAFALAAALLSLAPDLDALFFGVIPYGHFWGHRGFLHAPLPLALVGLAAGASVALLVRGAGPRLGLLTGGVFAWALASDGFLDAMTDGGLGVMLCWPWSTARFFLPWRPIAVAPIGVGAFFDPQGAAALLSETPFLVGFLAFGIGLRARLRRRREGAHASPA